MNAKVVFGGVPYALDAKKLEEAFPVPSLNEGRAITHEELAAVLGIEPQSQRYYGVINSWRNRLKIECGVHAHWEPAKGIKIVNPAELLSHDEKRIRQKGKQLGRSINELKWVPRERLDSTGQQRLDHMKIAAAKLKTSISDGIKEMAIELAPIKCLPRPIRKVS